MRVRTLYRCMTARPPHWTGNRDGGTQSFAEFTRSLTEFTQSKREFTQSKREFTQSKREFTQSKREFTRSKRESLGSAVAQMDRHSGRHTLKKLCVTPS